MTDKRPEDVASDALNYFQGYSDDTLENSEKDLLIVSKQLVKLTSGVLPDNNTKELIVRRLHASSSVCSVCGKKYCSGTIRGLPKTLDTEAVLQAINLDEFYHEEK